MIDDPFDTPQWREYAAHAREELVPMVRDASVTVSVLPPDSADIDIKFALELGAMILAEKPIIAIVTPGARVPAKLALIADEIVEGDTAESGFAERLNAAIERIKSTTTEGE